MEDLSALDHFAPDFPADPYWTESSWFSWSIPERDLCGLVWNHFRPNMNCVCGGPAAWDRSGRHVWEFRHFDFQTMRLLPEGRWGVDYDKFDYVTPWSMEVRMLEPLRRYRIGYDRAGFRLDLTFEAVAPPSVMGAPGSRALATAFRIHFEQPGRITGHIELDGERLAVDCFSIRDGGHGPRSMEDARPGAYCWSTASETSAWQILAPDASKGHTAKIIAGYYLRDGVMAKIVSGTRTVLEREGPRPVAVEIRATDELGRELVARGREQVSAEFMLFPDRGQWWSLFRWDYDGHCGATGEDQEYYGIHEFRRWHRGGPELWATR